MVRYKNIKIRFQIENSSLYRRIPSNVLTKGLCSSVQWSGEGGSSTLAQSGVSGMVIMDIPAAAPGLDACATCVAAKKWSIYLTRRATVTQANTSGACIST